MLVRFFRNFLSGFGSHKKRITLSESTPALRICGHLWSILLLLLRTQHYMGSNHLSTSTKMHLLDGAHSSCFVAWDTWQISPVPQLAAAQVNAPFMHVQRSVQPLVRKVSPLCRKIWQSISHGFYTNAWLS